MGRVGLRWAVISERDGPPNNFLLCQVPHLRCPCLLSEPSGILLSLPVTSSPAIPPAGRPCPAPHPTTAARPEPRRRIEAASTSLPSPSPWRYSAPSSLASPPAPAPPPDP
ncbi:hypothetical protein PVAP13_6KG406132 [Panicum virgatum]|uniref:Uncharacterized protein n=1 Tax=Panicum virgatum TaxID=38727 RepID=A0A8T0RI27_PANVG|nr:hypothetical protein PVAP13_6KG406132 [Panicum virgatum]